MPRVITLATALIAVCVFAIPSRAAAPPDPPAPSNEPKVELNELEKQFERTMSGATLVGRSSTDGKDDQLPKEDRYVISRVTKIGSDLWLFTAYIGSAKVPVPLPVPVKWAGDTPVISVTKLTVPGRGTFTARVVLYGDRYAGTWDAGDHGGQMWGRVERAGSTTKPSGQSSAKP